MMAATAKYRDDIAGAIVTAGTSTAYTVASYQIFDTLAHMNGAMIAFTPHATNGGTTTLNVDSLGAKPLRGQPSVELPSGALILGTPYVATYNNTDGAWYLQGGVSNPYNVPLLGGMDYWDTVAPNSSFIFPLGQAISRSVYASVFARWGTTYGVGDGSTTFNVPDKGGRVSAMKEATATRLTTGGSGVDGGTLGAVGGAQSVNLSIANINAFTPTGTISNGAITITQNANTNNGNQTTGGGAFTVVGQQTATITASQATSTFTGASLGSGTAHNNVQPTIVCNYVIRVL